MNGKADIGLVGLGVMGHNLALNLNDHGFTVSVFNRTLSRVDEFMNGDARGTKVIGTRSVEELLGTLKKPRKIMLMVKAGKPVDLLLENILPHLEVGDIVIDGGNSHFSDTMRRAADLESRGLLYVGCGISGGEDGARRGPSIMPGGSTDAWPLVKNILQSIAAKVADGTPCCDWMGTGGAGHFVKMVHNGIEYGDMQLISESYDLMMTALGMGPPEMSRVFAEWNKGRLNSFLVEITADILSFRDEDGKPIIDKILDAAGQKGTGKWTVTASMNSGVPLTMIGEAVFARFLSAIKEERVSASKILSDSYPTFKGNRDFFIEDIRQALYSSKIISYTQGYMLLQAASREYRWDLNYGGIALMWREGCIIRAALLDKIKEAFDRNPQLTNLLLDPYFKEHVQSAQDSWRRVVSRAAEMGIPLPAMSSALVFFDGYRRDRLPANLLQAQRDYFGAHTYERVDRPRGQFFHTDWTRRVGDGS